MPSLFGTDVARNPILRDVSRSFNGKSVREYEIDFNVDVSGSLGPDGALRRTFDVIAKTATPIMISETYDSGEKIKVFFEGDFGTDTYDGSTPQTFAAFLQAEIQALTTVDGVDLSGAEVTEATGSPYFADRVEAKYDDGE